MFGQILSRLSGLHAPLAASRVAVLRRLSSTGQQTAEPQSVSVFILIKLVHTCAVFHLEIVGNNRSSHSHLCCFARTWLFDSQDLTKTQKRLIHLEPIIYSDNNYCSINFIYM